MEEYEDNLEVEVELHWLKEDWVDFASSFSAASFEVFVFSPLFF
jgi:hypothetical protein